MLELSKLFASLMIVIIFVVALGIGMHLVTKSSLPVQRPDRPIIILQHK